MSQVTIRIYGYDLPGLQGCWGADTAESGGGLIHVGIQRGREVVDLVPGDAREARFELQIEVVTRPDGHTDFRGPYVHGKRGERFLYLSWGRLDAKGDFEMFRRAKLHFSTIDGGDLRRAVDTAAVLEAHLPLTDRRGGPICASVRPPTLRWELTTSQLAR